jgi:putative PIN family toxin of toxin-antitoxin system
VTPTVVYDCMIFLQALASDKGPAFACIQLVEQGRVKLVVSSAVFDEVRDVLNRFDIQTKFPRLVPERVQKFLEKVTNLSELIRDVPPIFKLPRDPKDEPYINLAIAAHAEFLVSWNKRHMGYLMAKDTPEGLDFCNRFPGIKILEPPAFLQILGDP